MANELLKFRKGLHANLPAVSANTVGTIYVTTDEKAMYVDISATERIRLGQTVTFATLAEFQNFLNNTIPPYSQEAFYYIEDKNALLKWVNSEGSTSIDGTSTKGTWKQINSTSDIAADLVALKEQVDANKSDISGLTTKVNTLTGTVGDASKGLVKELADLTDRVEANENAIGSDSDTASATGSLYARIKKNAEDIATNKSNISTNKDNIAANASDISTIKGQITTINEKNESQDTLLSGLRSDLGESNAGAGDGSAFARIKQLETKVGDATDVAGRLSAVESKANTNASNISKLQSDVSTNAGNIKTNADNISSLQSSVEGLDGRLDTAEGSIETLQNNYNSLKGTVDGHTTTIENHAGFIKTINSDISEIKANIGESTDAASDTDSLYARIKQNAENIASNDEDIANLQGRATSLETSVGTLNTTVGNHTTEIDTLKNKVSIFESNLNQIGNTYATKTELNDAKTELTNNINSKINAANAMTYKEGVSSWSELPTIASAGEDGIRIGDTYVVSESFNYNEVTYYAGDLLVADGTEENGKITSNLNWDHVKTGYIAAQENDLTAKDNQILLSSHLTPGTGDLGKVDIVGVGAVKVVTTEKTSSTNSKMTFSVEWEDF